MSTSFLLRMIAIAWLLAVCPARADLFLLQGGGQVRGEWINRQVRPQVYEIRLEHGGTIHLPAERVVEIDSETDAQKKYRDEAPGYADTAEAQWKLAEWCRLNRLPSQRRTHLHRVLELETDHLAARRALGFSQVRGQWVTKRQHFEKRGYEFYQGRWRMPQEIQLIKENKQAEEKAKGWLARLKNLREQLPTERGAWAAAQIAKIDDPQAVPALAVRLRQEPARAVRMLYIEALGKIPGAAADQALLYASLNHPDNEVFYACVTEIVAREPPQAARIYVKMLKDPNNVRINRAAYALAEMGVESSIAVLIDSLVTTHYQVIRSGSPESITTGFSSVTPAGQKCATPAAGGSPGANSLTSGQKTIVIPHVVSNQEVLDALVELSDGANFGFDQNAWRYWLASWEKSKLATAPPRRREE